MRIALINENSQAAKNEMVYNTLKKVAESKGHTVDQNGILAALLINSGAADFVVTGCGTGEGAMLALNSFPGVLCGHVVDPSDAYMFMQINDGNAISLPFAKGFGWGAELNLTYIFEKLFEGEPGGGYPKERVVPEQRNKKILDVVRKVAFKDSLIDILKNLDQDLVKGAVAGEKFQELFFANCKNPVPFGDCQIPGFSSFLSTSYFAVGDTLGVEDQVRIEGKNANDFVAELEQKGNEANKAALEAAKEAYAMIGIELNY